MHIHVQIHIPYMGPGRAAGSGADGRTGGRLFGCYLVVIWLLFGVIWLLFAAIWLLFAAIWLLFCVM